MYVRIVLIATVALFTFYPHSAFFATTSTPTLPTLAETETAVRSYFADVPAMILIAKCESGFRQYNTNGTPLRGSGLYIGVFQVDEKIHAGTARGMGMDIYTLDGNLAYAKYLYDQAGTRPWAGCVANSDAATTTQTAPSSYALTRNLKIGNTNLQVRIMQQLLNSAGFTVAKSGPGSPDNETNFFGSLTRAAVQRFQCAKGIVCEGNEATTGYGNVGPRTRAMLLQAVPTK